MALVGLALLVFLWFYLLHVPQTPGRMERASAQLFGRVPVWEAVASIGSLLPRDPTQVVLVVVIASTLAFVGYATAIWLAWPPAGIWVTRIAIIGAVVFVSLPLIALPNQEGDIWDYISHGRVSAVHDASPYEVAPSAYPDDPLYRYASPEYRGAVTPYLPVWTVVSTTLASVGGSDPITALMTYRIAFWIMNLASLGLIILLTRWTQPAKTTAAIVLWAWNPIVSIWGEKVDALMVLLLLITALIVVRRKARQWIVPLTLSVLVKLISLPLIVVHLVTVARRKGAAPVVWSGLLALVIAALAYVPFYRGPSLLTAQIALLSRGGSALPEFLRPIADLAFLGLLVGLGWFIRDNPRSIFNGWAAALLTVGIVFTAPNFPWYLMTLIAMIALAGNPWLIAAAVPVALVSFLVNAREYVLTPAFTTDAIFIPPRATLYAGIAALVVLALIARYLRLKPWADWTSTTPGD